MSYKFVFTTGETVRVPMWYRTKNDDGTRTPINLTGCRLIAKFTARGKSTPLLTLDTNDSANANGSRLRIVTAADGKFEFLITDEEIAAMPKCFGRWTLDFIDSAGELRPLTEAPFSRQ